MKQTNGMLAIREAWAESIVSEIERDFGLQSSTKETPIMKPETSHAPTPWSISPSGGITAHGEAIIINDAETIINYHAKPFNDGFGRAAANAAFIVRAVNSHEALLAALKAATERMEAVAESIPVENRSEGVSQATHVRHMAGHLAQHAKIARAAIALAEGRETA